MRDIAAHFDREAAEYPTHIGADYIQTRKWTLIDTHAPETGIVADIGSANGRHALEIARRLDVVAVDPSEQMLARLVQRADARDLDGYLHVDACGAIRGLAMVFNPLDVEVERSWRLPLYYTGLRGTARIREAEGESHTFALDRDDSVTLQICVPARGLTWFVLEPA